MFKMATSQEIGEYLSKLVSEKYASQRQFCIKWIEDEGTSKEEQEIKNRQNKFSQIKKGENNIPVTDLESICKLLEVSCEELLSAGKYFIPDMARLTNYNVAFSHDKDIWERYINHPDNPILNPDEYGKTVIDYAIYYKNIEFINYLIEKEYIWFDAEDIHGNKNDYKGCGFRAGTSIKGRNIGNVDYYMPTQLSNYKLRNRLIMLAIENGNVNLLERTLARELPYVFDYNIPFFREPEEFKECNEDEIIKSMGEASNEIVEYMTEPFEFDLDMGTFYLMYFRISNILNVLIEKKHSHTKNALRNAVNYSKKSYKDLKECIKRSVIGVYNDEFGSMDELYKNQLKNAKDNYFPEEICKENEEKLMNFRKQNLINAIHIVTDNVFYLRNNNFVSIQNIVGSRCEKHMSNLIYVDVEPTDPELKKLVNELNQYYEKILSIKDEMEEYDYAKIMF